MSRLTQATEETDPNLLYNLQTRIRGHAIIDPAEQQRAVQAFLDAQGQPKGAAHKTLYANVDPAVSRFETQLAAEDQADLRDALKAYTRAYAFLGQVVPFSDPDLESLFYYAKLLLDRLPDDRSDRGAIDLGDTALQFIGHEAGIVTSGALQHTDSDGQIETFTGGGRGSAQDPVLARLPEIIRSSTTPTASTSAKPRHSCCSSSCPPTWPTTSGCRRSRRTTAKSSSASPWREDDVAGAIFDRQEASDRLLKLFTEDSRFADEVMKHIRSATYQAARARARE